MTEFRYRCTPEILIPVDETPTWREAYWEPEMCVGYPRGLEQRGRWKPVLLEGERLLETELGPVGIISLNP